jgi:hypothetical protein
MVLFKHGKKEDGLIVYVHKDTVLKELAAKIEQVKLPVLF